MEGNEVSEEAQISYFHKHCHILVLQDILYLPILTTDRGLMRLNGSKLGQSF